MRKIAVIIVTHNSEAVLGACIRALEQFGRDCTLCIVDSGSTEPSYLLPFEGRDDIKLIRQKNIGFSRANNMGYGEVAEGAEYVVFLNPDAFIVSDTFSRAQEALQRDSKIGCLGGRMLGYDVAAGQPTGRLDSTGIFRQWYGRWRDRGQGESDHGQYVLFGEVPAICGAFMFCRKTALEQTALARNVIFDPEFFLYKEDIELSLRLRKNKWKVVYLPEVKVYHCRGWKIDRQSMDHALRLQAARSELLLWKRYKSWTGFYSLMKYIAVRFLRM